MKRILLVEDDEPIRDVFNILFKDSDYEVVELDNGEKVINGEIDVPDLFILDKNISGMNGLDICRFIKSSKKYINIPVIMLSACPDIRALAKEAGADDAIAKPFSLKNLRETIYIYLSPKKM